MKEKRRAAVRILHHRYIKDDVSRITSLETERVNAQVARMIYELRQEAGLSQGQLADIVGTTQSVISRLEDADYEGHSLTMLQRIAKALSCKVSIDFTREDPNVVKMKYVFSELIKGLRLEKGWNINEFAKKSGIDRDEIVSMEKDISYRPSPLILYKLSNIFHIPQTKLAFLAGAFRRVPKEIEEQASRFAAQSESFSKLEPEERRILDEFVKFLREEKNYSE